MIYQNIIITAIGSPILRLDECSELQTSFTCISTTITLHWDIDFLSGDDLNRVSFFKSDKTGKNYTFMNRGTGIVYHFNLTSKCPLTSTMTTNTPTDLSGARISCSLNGTQSSADVTRLILPGIIKLATTL